MFHFDSSQYSFPTSKVGGRVRKSVYWTPPSVGMVKFNVDGSVFGKPGPTGISRVLKNHEGIKLMCFSKHIVLEESNVAEIMAIKEAEANQRADQLAKKGAM
ncbi:hypothetical protein PTKIN_Ptkin01aG0250300 [Pterospermum kingtungense]